jgi:hypothetical protein
MQTLCCFEPARSTSAVTNNVNIEEKLTTSRQLGPTTVPEKGQARYPRQFGAHAATTRRCRLVNRGIPPSCNSKNRLDQPLKSSVGDFSAGGPSRVACPA